MDRKEKLDLEAPEDKYRIIYISLFFLGLVHLLPWTFFMTATGFWMYKFRNTTINETDSEFRTTLQANFSASLLITLQISDVAFLFIGLIFGRYIRVRVRIIGILSIIFTLFAITTAFIKVDTDSWQVGFFVVVMAIGAGVNALNAVFTITIFTVLSNFPQHYLAPYLAGGGISRIFTSILQIISLATGLSVQDSALVYFSLGLFVIAFSLIYYISISRNPFYLHHMRNYQEGKKEERVGYVEGLRLLKKIWSPVIIMGFYLLGTNASPVTLVVSEGEGEGAWYDTYYVPTISFFLASLCDLIGRHIGFAYAPNMSQAAWVFFAAARTILMIPLVMLCNAQPRDHMPVLLPHDYQYIIITIVFNITGGYLITRSNYNIASLVSKEELKDAYHVNMVMSGVQMGILSFLGVVSVKLL